MKKLLIILLLIISQGMANSLFCSVKFENVLNKKQMNFSLGKLKASGNKVFFNYQSGYDYIIYEYIYSLVYFNGSKWQDIEKPNTNFNVFSFDIDKTGNVWVAAPDGLWKYDWNSWEKYVVNDSFAGTRQYFRLCIDSSGNVWVATRTAFIKEIKSGSKFFETPIYHELFKFNGKSFETMDYIANDKVCVFEDDFGLITAPDGTVYAHNTMNGNEANDWFLYKNNQKTLKTIHNPHYNIKNLNKFISQIYPDKQGNIWFCHTNSWNDPGLTVIKQDGTWQTIGTSNGFYYFGSNYSDIYNDSIYMSCNAIYQDDTGGFWIGGNQFLGYLDNNTNFQKPDNSFFNNIILYGCEDNYYSKTDSIRQAYLWAITHYPEIQGINHVGIVSSVLGITETDDGSIWFLMNSFGALRYQPTVGVNESENLAQSDVSMYPQPVSLADGIVNFRLGSNLTAKTIRIYSATGSLIVQKDCNYAVGSVQLQIPKNIAQTCYFVEIICTDKVFRKMLIITN